MSSYKTICPSCGGDNFYVTEHNGVGYCFSPGCGYTEVDGQSKRKEYVKRRSPMLSEIRDLYGRMTDYYHSALDKPALDFLYSRGYTDGTIQRLRIGYVPNEQSLLYRSEIAKEAGLSTYDGRAFLAGRVVFPYLSKHNIVTDIRGRDITGEEELKYKSPHGPTYYRGADYPYNYFLRDEEVIIITEGEVKAGIGFQNGYAIMALPGMGSWREGFKAREGQRTILLFDTQEGSEYDIRRAVIRASDKLLNPEVATLPAMGKGKMDIDTFIVEYGPKLFDMVIKAAIPFSKWIRLQR